MKPFVVNLSTTVLIVAIALALYDRLIFQPSRQIGVVDVGEVYRAKEAQFAQRLTHGSNEQERQQAILLARQFAQRLPAALDELPRECRCLVVVKSSIIGSSTHLVDLTPLLKRKVDL
ncbi:hypothetical protein [Noviherbaspirillum autotrophicum]|uniref:Uncharacterized protein n=1 Tax=Noviherbaspirillum autotrophicum TaxID=709839 RepID=A0A0C2BK48_9BURK|nr:hypothetical protein [Noviherbaspirillum autotrophicum]KIF81620.1 hypothetical protein TSA66_13730 [Noviherbaspirillum autotrophicum]